jgi:hypothetical protein
LGIIEYEHVDPEFHEAYAHDPEKITLLCPTHHAKVTRGFLSKNAVKAALADPFCKKVGFSYEFFDFGVNLHILGWVKSHALRREL